MSLLGFLGKVATGFVAGGPAGAIVAGAAHVAQQLQPKGQTPTPAVKVPTTGITGLLQQVQNTRATTFAAPAINVASVGPGKPPPLLPDSSRTSGVTLGPGGLQIGTTTNYYPTSSPQNGAGCAKGFHLNKTGYYTRQGYVAPGTRCVKNRRRNPLNPRALSRSISRIQSAKNAAKFLSRVSVRERGCSGCR